MFPLAMPSLYDSDSSPAASQSASKLLIESDSGDATERSERVLACDAQGGSLTLLEEYSRRNATLGKWNAFLAGLCAIISLAFTCFTYFNTL